MRLSETGRQCWCRSWADALRKRRHGTRRLYRAIDRDGNPIDARLSEHRDRQAAKAFFRSARATMGFRPDRVTTDGHGSYPRAIRTVLGKTSRPEGRRMHGRGII